MAAVDGTKVEEKNWGCSQLSEFEDWSINKNKIKFGSTMFRVLQ